MEGPQKEIELTDKEGFNGMVASFSGENVDPYRPYDVNIGYDDVGQFATVVDRKSGQKIVVQIGPSVDRANRVHQHALDVYGKCHSTKAMADELETFVSGK